MNKSIKNAAQAGFTLIELIVVIVILGILAATALPKFADMSSDARAASMSGAKGALSAAAAMVHGKHMIKAEDPMTIEGVTVDIVNGYPSASTIAAVAGLDGFDVLDPGAPGANSPGVDADEFVIVPKGVKGTPTAATCFIKYTEAEANKAPVISNVPDVDECD